MREGRAAALILNVHVQPRAGNTAYAGHYGERIKIRLQAPPVSGAANRALIQWLASEFDVPASAIQLLSGKTGRDKRLAVVHPRRFPPWFCDPRD
ncbi:MAG TPA: DUF167 domain-containing protein [Gammaproteobacteria bacterium]|nr:DUF167 domain-containing protein [Gammaproteobacteria bacterium]